VNYDRVRPVPVILLGPGKVGRSLLDRILRRRDVLAQKDGLRLDLVAVDDGSACVLADEGRPLDAARLRAICDAKSDGRPLRGLFGAGPSGAWRSPDRLRGYSVRPIVVDSSAAENSAALLEARALGWRLVLANKSPLCGSLGSFRLLTAPGAAWEATVAAALPVVAVLTQLLAADDPPLQIRACVSGTLGFVASRLAEGVPLSHIVVEADALGYVEPDPRADLSGMDSARKALILARMMGLELDLDAVAVEGLYPAEWDGLSARDFLDRLPAQDAGLSGRAAAVAMSGRVLRYVITIEEGQVRAGLEDLAPTDALARAPASDSIVVMRSKVFDAQPLVLSGRGGGPAGTASCVYGDLVALARELRR
jgi:homoserine dehydrogenase